ncbi:hypothetical protein M885DRAFT_457242 [Pelagophyceae sp. CCMP2097]|nr:hypothetical protein M885DRAFT_457242 [Pelagophyceae sp. CCMP2097]
MAEAPLAFGASYTCAAPTGQCAVFRLEAVDRVEKPSGANGGPPGLPCWKFLSLSEAAQADFAETVSGGGFVPYAVEHLAEDAYYVFLEVPDKAALWNEAFLDRGVRKAVAVGSRVLVATAATVAAWPGLAVGESALVEGRVSFVWNCGRCGSTLMHRALGAAGVASSSEPHWCDQMMLRAPGAASGAAWRDAAKLCLALEFSMCAQPGAARFSLNPKNIAGGAPLAAAVADIFPNCKHCFMYRSLEKVADSFGKFLYEAQAPDAEAADRAAWRGAGVGSLPLFPLYSQKLEAAVRSGALPVGEASNANVAAELVKWLDAVVPWLELRQIRRDDAVAHALNLRYDEFVGAATRATAVEAALRHLVGDAAALDAALAVFESDSQAGTTMTQRGAPAQKAAPFLCAADVAIARGCVLKVQGVLGVPLLAMQGGANCTIPKSACLEAA